MKTDKLGIMTVKLQNSGFDLNAIRLIENISNKEPYKESCLFSSYVDTILPPNVPVLHLVHGKFFSGDMIVTDMVGLLMCKNFPNLKTIILYAQNIPWYGQQNTMHEQWAMLLGLPNLEIIAQNQEIHDIFEICYKKPIGISENFTHEELSQFI